jgi:hypothetical protein
MMRTARIEDIELARMSQEEHHNAVDEDDLSDTESLDGGAQTSLLHSDGRTRGPERYRQEMGRVGTANGGKGTLWPQVKDIVIEVRNQI